MLATPSLPPTHRCDSPRCCRASTPFSPATTAQQDRRNILSLLGSCRDGEREVGASCRCGRETEGWRFPPDSAISPERLLSPFSTWVLKSSPRGCALSCSPHHVRFMSHILQLERFILLYHSFRGSSVQYSTPPSSTERSSCTLVY